jgi:hypothetical protein
MPTISPIKPSALHPNKPLNHTAGRDGSIEQVHELRYRFHSFSAASYQLSEPAIFDIFEEFKTLEVGWDGEGGCPISPEAIDAAKIIIKQTFLQASSLDLNKWIEPEVSPTPDGGLDLEWEVGQFYLMIHITGEGVIRYLLRFARSKRGSGTMSIGQAIAIVVNLFFNT